MTNHDDYKKCMKESHHSRINKFASEGDNIYSNWNYEYEGSYIQANYFARFPGEFLGDFASVSPLHRTTALSEVAKQKLVYKCWVHVPQKWKEGAWGEPIVDMFVEGVLGFLAMRAAQKKQYENVTADCYDQYLLPDKTSKHFKQNVVVLTDPFFKRWVSFLVHMCKLVNDIISEKSVKEDPRGKYRGRNLNVFPTHQLLDEPMSKTPLTRGD